MACFIGKKYFENLSQKGLEIRNKTLIQEHN